MRREGRDLPKVAVQGRRRCNPSSLIQFQLKRTRGRARELLFSWCNRTKREEERVAKIREKPREKFERVSPREEEDAICEMSHPFIKEWMAKIFPP